MLLETLLIDYILKLLLALYVMGDLQKRNAICFSTKFRGTNSNPQGSTFDTTIDSRAPITLTLSLTGI